MLTSTEGQNATDQQLNNKNGSNGRGCDNDDSSGDD
jgi:hypothetical protein